MDIDDYMEKLKALPKQAVIDLDHLKVLLLIAETNDCDDPEGRLGVCSAMEASRKAIADAEAREFNVRVGFIRYVGRMKPAPYPYDFAYDEGDCDEV